MRIISVFLVLLFLISCSKTQKKEEELEKYNGMTLTESRSKTLKGNISYTLDLPDTLKVNQAYEAGFKFDSPFDKIVEPMVSNDSLKFRIITMFYFKPIKVGVKNKESDFVIKDSIYIPNKEFTLENFKIGEKGKYVFLVLIEDKIIYYYYSKGIRDSIHYDRIFEEITKEVVVIE
ncbi:MAG: hypothetical protein LBI72_07580 [Flavobacteriaceae bacterium]|jgi:uncharacterized protein (DUF2164 family)|nr:hypothetical protein [Flavobacteriaceae bacterium]